MKKLKGGCNVGCGTCAFRKGSETRGETYNTLKATLCVLGAVPFYCHYTKNGEDLHTDKPRLLKTNDMKVCDGWKQAIRKQLKLGNLRPELAQKRSLAKVALAALEAFVDEKEGTPEKAEMKIVLLNSIKLLSAKREDHEQRAT